MKSSGTNGFKLPIFSWLLFLFLTSGISYLQQDNNTVSIELVDAVSQSIGRKNNIAQYSVDISKKTLFQKPQFYFLQLNSLSQKLDNLVSIAFVSSFRDILSQNIVSHFRSRTLTSGNSGGTDHFIS